MPARKMEEEMSTSNLDHKRGPKVASPKNHGDLEKFRSSRNQKELLDHLEYCARVVKSWPKWKREISVGF